MLLKQLKHVADALLLALPSVNICPQNDVYKFRWSSSSAEKRIIKLEEHTHTLDLKLYSLIVFAGGVFIVCPISYFLLLLLLHLFPFSSFCFRPSRWRMENGLQHCVSLMISLLSTGSGSGACRVTSIEAEPGKELYVRWWWSSSWWGVRREEKYKWKCNFTVRVLADGAAKKTSNNMQRSSSSRLTKEMEEKKKLIKLPILYSFNAAAAALAQRVTNYVNIRWLSPCYYF